VDYSEYGGAPLLGLNKACIICHGMSDTKAIKNAVRIASDFITKDVSSHIFHDISAIKRLIENKEVTLGEAR
jgi:glycerol-3-phosphate acyltransferase PlsX